MSPLTEATLRACFKLLAGEPVNGLPASVAHYIEGMADELPADLNWIPENMRGVLPIMRDIAQGNREDCTAPAKVTAAAAESRAADEARAVLNRIAKASRTGG